MFSKCNRKVMSRINVMYNKNNLIFMRYKHELGIVGLPNVGKSTLYNVLVGKNHAVVGNYPFCTIKANQAKVSISQDKRLDELARIAKSKQTIYGQLTFTDIAGLIKGASQGAGLGNQFLASIREVEAILHVVRCFSNDNVTHVDGLDHIDPINDIQTIETELCLADLNVVENQIKKQQRASQKNNKYVSLLEKCSELLNDGTVLTNFGEWTEEEWKYLKQLNLLTTKPVCFVCNSDNDNDNELNKYEEDVMNFAKQRPQFVRMKFKNDTPCISINASFEEEMLDLDEESRAEFSTSDSGFSKVVKHLNELLGIHSFYTVGEKESRAWPIEIGTTAVDAASKIHSDISKGFIKAEVIKPQDYMEFNGDEIKLRKEGKIYTMGKTYVVEDGDIMLFKFRN